MGVWRRACVPTDYCLRAAAQVGELLEEGGLQLILDACEAHGQAQTAIAHPASNPIPTQSATPFQPILQPHPA